MKVCWSRISL